MYTYSKPLQKQYCYISSDCSAAVAGGGGGDNEESI